MPVTIDSKRDQRILAARIWYGVLSIVALLVLSASVLTMAAASPKTCELCHAQEATVTAAGAHADATCEDCHAGTGATGLFASRLAVVDMTAAQLSGTQPLGGTPIDDARCLRCHTKEHLSATVTRNGVRMNHRAPLQKGIACISCHPEAGHSSGSTGRLGYSMDSCLSCHSADPKDLNSCTLCHGDPNGPRHQSAQQTPWRVTHGAGWKTTHGMGNLRTCRSCHAQTYCLTCHNVPVPHDEGYIGTHGAVFKSLTSDQQTGCFTCHKKTTCDNCHGMQMPHPSDFLGRHPKVANADKQRCMRCHAQESCDGCHVRHTHPGLSENVKQKLRANPVQTP